MKIAINKTRTGFESWWSSKLYHYLMDVCGWQAVNDRGAMHQDFKVPTIVRYWQSQEGRQVRVAWYKVVVPGSITPKQLRSHRDVISAIEYLGKEASIYGVTLGVAEVPDDVDWCIGHVNVSGKQVEVVTERKRVWCSCSNPETCTMHVVGDGYR